MKLRNCTKSGKANAEIFSELAWNNFRIWRYFPNKGGSFSEVIRSIRIIPNFFPRSFGVFGQFRIFFRGQFGVFGQFRIFFRAHSEYSDNSELFPGIPNWFPNYMRKKYGNSSKSSVFSRKYFFSHSEKSEYSELYFPS
jgi:hypothetical protein